MGDRVINDAGRQLIKESEGQAGEYYPKAYKCPAGVWTIGWGHTKNVKRGDTCTLDQAELFLTQDLRTAEQFVQRHIKSATDNQFSAMVSLCFNIGVGNFLDSTVLRKHNLGDFKGAAEAFSLWNKAGGKVLKGLVIRRQKEAELYSKE